MVTVIIILCFFAPVIVGFLVLFGYVICAIIALAFHAAYHFFFDG